MKVSVVMAAKNYARFLPMAVRSVSAQTFQDWELVIVDDGSTDETCEAVKPFLIDGRIRYVASDCLGQSRAKNLGVRFSRGELIAFLDADDAWRPTKLAKQIETIEANPAIGVVATDREIINAELFEDIFSERGVLTPRASLARGVNTPRSEDAISRDEIFIANPICFSSVLVRREVFDRIGGFDPELDLSIDYDLWLRAAAHYEFACIPEKLTLYRTGHGNLSKKQSDRIATAFTIMNRRSRGVSQSAINRGFGSTCQSMAWLHRAEEKHRAVEWYARSFAWPGHRLSAIKGIAGTILDSLRKRHGSTSPENRSVNC